DSVHALIERSSKNKLIYTPDEWYTLVRWAKQNSPPYTVVEVNQDLVLDFKAWLHTKNWIKDTNLEKISWNKIREVKVQRNNSDIIEFKYNFFEENYRKLNCGNNLKLTRGRKKKEKEVILEKVYNNPIPITEVKYRDLISLCDTMIIPKKYHTFYNNLKHSKEEQGNDEEDC
ncbi:jg8080, partial [Pararge aegeria aegeria]